MGSEGTTYATLAALRRALPSEVMKLRRLVPPEDAPRMRAFASRLTSELVGRPHGSALDFVADVVDPFALRYMQEWFGLPDPGDGALLRWMRVVTFYIFGVYFITGPRVELPALRSARELRSHTEAVIALRRAQPQAADDSIARSIRLRDDPATALDDRDAARCLLGLIAGGLIAPMLVAVNVFDRLLDLPAQQLAGARAAARQNEDEVIKDYVLEASRLAPFPGLIWRYSERDTVIARGTSHERRVAAGTLVALLISAANVDPTAVAEPHRFRLQRPASERLLFGHAQHACLGSHIGVELIAQMIKVVLAQPRCERLPSADGRMRRGTRGSFPDEMFPAHLGVRVR